MVSSMLKITHYNKHFVGSTYLDEHNETTLAVLHWKEAHEIRSKDSGYIGTYLAFSDDQNIIMLFNVVMQVFDCVVIFFFHYSQRTDGAIAFGLL